MAKRKILLTAALPYANGDIHIGHLVEYLQADIWTRFQKMRGHDCHYFCADDTHGTPIMISAQKEGIPPEEWIQKCHSRHEKDFQDFQIKFDQFYTTHSEENKETVEEIFNALEAKGLVITKPVKQPYCEIDKMFLPDRFIKGTCPKCSAEDQYGDSCDVCGATYNPTDLKSPQCAVCGNTPIEGESDHVFYKLNEHQEFLKQWVKDHTSPGIAKKLMEWLEGELRDWDISRDAPYFGFEIPGHPKKFFYVWTDAPVGYIATTKKWCKENNRDFSEFWKSEDAEIYHFIGKDIVYHHALFWPFMLHNAGFRTPSQIFVHGMLSVNGEKMSKSRGTFINARTYLNHADPMYLRYYYASKLTSSVDDFDFSFDDFASRVNSDLVGKITNLASRGAQMLKKRIDGKMGEIPEDGARLIKLSQEKSEIIAEHFENRDYAKAIIEIRQIADEANRYFDEKQPWKSIKEDVEATRGVLTTILNVFRNLTIYLQPVMPEYSKNVQSLFGEPEYSWESIKTPLTHHEIGHFKHLATRLDPAQLDKIVEEEKSKVTQKQPAKKSKPRGEDELASPITYDDFMKVDLRVGEIIEAKEIQEANKLLNLTISLGELGQRNIIAGIKSAYTAEQLVGRKTVVVANLTPRKMKFGVSEGMVIAAGPGGKDIYILSPDDGSQPGQRVQ